MNEFVVTTNKRLNKTVLKRKSLMNQSIWRFNATLLLLIPSMLFAFSGGKGTVDDPFQITTATHLDSLRYYLGISMSNTSFKLMNDIDLSNWLSPGNPGYNDGAFWLPIGDSAHPFYGKLDGNDFTVTGLKINRAETSFSGLLGVVGYSGKLNNIRVVIAEDDSVNGQSFTGGIVGKNDSGTVSGCIVSGRINGCTNVGGLMGGNINGTVSNCHVSGTVTGDTMVGGLVGFNRKGLVNTCGSSSRVSGICMIGGLVGKKDAGIISNCAASDTVIGRWDVGGLVGYGLSGSTTKCSTSVSVIGGNGIGGLQGVSLWDAVSDCYASGAVNGSGSGCGGLIGGYQYSNLSNCNASGSVSGTNAVGGLLGSYDQGIISDCHATGAVFGTEGVGGLIGSISNYQQYAHLDSCFASGSVKGTDRVGGLIGVCYGSMGLIRCYAAGKVSGTDLVGGLVGAIKNGGLGECYASGAVEGRIAVGGLLGSIDSVTVTACYANGTVNGSNEVGGLVGDAENGTVRECYASGMVQCTSTVGGLVGYIYEKKVISSYWDKQTTKQDSSYASDSSFGKTTAEMKTQSTFIGWDFTKLWTIANEINNGYPYLQWQKVSNMVLPLHQRPRHGFNFQWSNNTLIISGIGEHDNIAVYSATGRCLRKVRGLSRVNLHEISPQPLFVVVYCRNNKVISELLRPR